ncbi:hypothetical protein chiPu_0014066 [Chiloscyllium punctatum]|uniref:Fanconi anemia group D2 protein n=1 Tax=Chiloscyllium punctatum TaxID=137246 RepID=A0A401SYW7_CHIPU|nr:hypothetical protein [Chiloscyllium punctatum]
MVAKRRLSKSADEHDEANAKDLSKAKKSKIGGRKRTTSAQEGEVDDDTVFVHLLKSAGMILKQGNQPNKLSLDQAVFQKKLCQTLRKHPRYPNVVQEFVSGLESHIEGRDKFRNCLLPCGQSQEGESSNNLNYQESLIKLLLGIEILQPSVMNTLFEKIPEFMYDGIPEDGINMPRLIISQFKWLDRIIDSKDLTSKIMQLISVGPLEIQRDIITSLPEILEDAQHNEIAKELNSLLQQNTQLTVPILDALSSLNLHAELLIEVRHSVMSTLSAVKLDDLPVVVKFIFHAIRTEDAVEVITELRMNLGLESCVLPSQLQTSRDKQKQKSVAGALVNQENSGHDCVAIMFDVIKAAIRFQKATAEAWIKAIEVVDSAAGHKVIDLLVLLILHTTSTNNIKKQVEKLLRSKVRLGHIGDQLLQIAFRSHVAVVREYFPSVLSLAQTLLRSSDVTVVSFGSQMYKHAFMMFDSYCQQATALLELVRTCSEQSPEAAALYYDELANLVQKGNLDPQVQELIGRSVLDDFQEDFVVDLLPETDSECMLPLKSMFNLDEEDTEGGIVINLLPLLSNSVTNNGFENAAGKQRNKKCISPVCLASFFRLLRFCEEVQNNGNLEEIDALLGCPLYLTNFELVEKVESLSKQERELLCSVLFHTLNWFREVVNAFCKQQDTEMKGKVLLRLQNITHLQVLLEKCLAATPGYIPPLANFDLEVTEVPVTVSHAAPAKKGKKDQKVKKKPKSDGNKNSSTDSSQTEEPTEESQMQSESTQGKENTEEGKVFVNLSNYRAYFREMDTDVFFVLKCGLVTKSVLDTELHTKATEVVQLGSAELVFLLEDLARKLDYMLVATAAKKMLFLKVKGDRDVGFSHLRQMTPQALAQTAIELLNPLCNHLESVHNYFQVMITENNGVVDVLGTDVKENQRMAACYQLLLQILNTLFAWCGFAQHENRKLLRLALGVLANRLKEGDGEMEMEELIRQTFRYLQNFQNSIPRCTSAVNLTQLLIVIAEKSLDNQYKEKIASITRGFLCQSWVLPNGEKEKGNKYNEALETLLCIYLKHTDDVLKSVEEIAGVGVPELLNSTKDGSSNTFPTLSRQTFVIFYRVMMSELDKSVKSIPAGMQSDSTEVQVEKLLRWNVAVRDFHILVNLVKVFDSRPVLGVCLKHGRLFIESFLKQGMPLLDYTFKKHREDVQSLLKTLQLSTRQLHHMCGHTKLSQDTNLTNHVPPLKKLLELFVYRVKAMLTINKCQEAFWLGNLKNRDLQGEEIMSQTSQQESGGDEESELPEDDTEEETEELDDCEAETRKTTRDDEGSTEDSDSD